MKRQPSEWEKIIANEKTDKDLISKIYQQLIHLNTRKNKQPSQKMGGKHFSKEDIQMASKEMLNIARYKRNANQKVHLTPVRMVIIKKSGNDIYWRGCGEKGALLHC